MAIPTDTEAAIYTVVDDVKRLLRSEYPNQANHIEVVGTQCLGFPPGAGNGAIVAELYDKEDSRCIGSVNANRVEGDLRYVMSQFRR